MTCTTGNIENKKIKFIKHFWTKIRAQKNGKSVKTVDRMLINVDSVQTYKMSIYILTIKIFLIVK